MSANETTAITLSLSVEAIKESIYAISAMRSYLADTACELPPMLTRDHSAALTPVIRSAAVYVAMRLPELGMDIAAGDDGDLLTIAVAAPSSLLSPLRHAVEEAVLARSVSCCFLSCDASISARYADDCDRLIDSIRDKAGANMAVPRLRPVSY